VQLRQALHDGLARLEAARLVGVDIDAARLSAEVLLFHVAHCDRAHLYAHPERELTPDEQQQYEALIARRAAGEPLQYIIGHQEFWRMDFRVTPAVLIPRPETEHLVEQTLVLARKFHPEAFAEAAHGTDLQEKALRGKALRLIDVGTGSGAIAVSLAVELPQAEVAAVDLSPEALDVARQNAERLGARVQFTVSDVLESIPEEPVFDFVVSNPPYVGLDEADKVQQVVLQNEPHLALFAGAEGLAVIRRLIPQAGARLRPGGWLLMEIGWSQSEMVKALLVGWHNIHVINDLAGVPRIVVARKTL
jgi:release factor glutamine methyltransferase